MLLNHPDPNLNAKTLNSMYVVINILCGFTLQDEIFGGDDDCPWMITMALGSGLSSSPLGYMYNVCVVE